MVAWGAPESDGGAPLEGYKVAVRDAKRHMWMEVGRVAADVQKLKVQELAVSTIYSRSLHSAEKYPKNIPHCAKPHYANLYKNSNNFPPNNCTMQIITTHCARTFKKTALVQIPYCAKLHCARTYCIFISHSIYLQRCTFKK